MDLTFLGLTQKESNIYQALLSLGESTAKELASKTRIDRASIYDIIDGLIKKNLVFKKDTNKVLRFAPHDPKNILLGLNEKEVRLREMLPELTQKFRTATKHSFVRIHEGEEALTKLYDSILEIKDLKEYDIICSEQDWLKMNPRYFERFKDKRSQKGIKTRLIMEASLAAEERKKNKVKTFSEVKILPPAFSPLHFSAGCYILNDRVIFVGYRKEHTATEIFSQEIVAFMKNIFEFMWKTIA